MRADLTFRAWLKQRRRELDLTQEALAAAVGCAVETIRKFEAGRRRPSRQMAARLAEALQLSAADRARFVAAARAEADAAVQVEEAPSSAVSPGMAPVGPSASDAAGVRPPVLSMDTVTFLYTDIEGSTALWEDVPAAMPAALARHDTVLRDAISAHRGIVYRSTGDGLCASFPTALEGAEAALAIQRQVQAEAWEATGPLRVRIALHTGAAEAGVNYREEFSTIIG